ncbi:NAD(P)-dependent oxidoreductase [Roseomonas sp. HF4]|uniref:NAD(P)-dependent oxidoreductase n=1 Tax=Roseomonas sp. HF4 TaxID=2562313 RepID=UPI0010BF6FBD|nr:NAD(P)-dependent oxidoreductase [Roseomonas sp. HF4]
MVAVVGLGNMGMAMVTRLVGLGLSPGAWDLDAGKRAAAGAVGAAVPASLPGVADAVVLLSLPNEAAVAAVLEALLPALPRGAVVADTSTLSPQGARDFAGRVAAAGCRYLDAPVSGGPAGAAAGTLAMMVGGEAAALEAVRPDLARLTARLIHVGPPGAGQVAKLVNNLLVATHLVVAAEALRLGALAGVAPEALMPVINGASGRSAATEVNWPRWIATGAFDSGFTAGLMRKDVRLALGLAEAVGAPLDATGRAAAAWEALAEAVPDAADFNRLAAAIFEGATP